MVQRSQVVDITKSYFPCDPNSFVQNLVNTDKEDGEEKTFSLLAFQGHNFIPTANGYRSYFGVSTELTVGGLTSRTQFILSYQLSNYRTKLIALCEDGIWSLDANTLNAVWVHEVTYAYNSAIFEEWTYCVIENILYMYQQGRSEVYKTLDTAGVLTFVDFIPSFLNMAGQLGIFKAGLRLGFWDSQNSIAWSSNLDLADFTPAIETGVANTIFGDIIGNIVTIKSHGEGFIIYCTKAIVSAMWQQVGMLIFEAKKIFDNVGIFYSRAVTFGQSDTDHFVWATNGFYRLGKYNPLSGKHDIENIATDLYDFLRESRDPVYLDIINARYIFVGVLNSDYIYGITIGTYAPITPLASPLLLQTGSPRPLYPILSGAYVFDLNLKKWGKMKNRYEVLVDLQSINIAILSPILEDDKGMTAGLKTIAGDIAIFDDEPSDSTITYGKVGHYRLGMSNLLEVKVMFRDPKTGTLLLDSSMDGRNLDPTLQYTLAFTNAEIVESLPDISARWHIITIEGNYDIVGLEARDVVVSRR